MDVAFKNKINKKTFLIQTFKSYTQIKIQGIQVSSTWIYQLNNRSI
ncbi:MAG: hypothetical protein ACJAV8_000405 [Polaribacter sp.]|jgi:hypothetical protein